MTVLDPAVRVIIDSAADGGFRSLHVDSIAEAVTAVKEYSPTALLVSPSIAKRHPLCDIRALIAKSPAVTAVVVLADDWPSSHDALLHLGACGIGRVVNLAEREGWNQLRHLADRSGGEGAVLIMREILRAAEGASDEVQRFFATIVRLAPDIVTVRALGRALDISPSTLMSRFFRAQLPAPKCYLSMTRLLFAAYFLEQPKVTIAATADALHYSSPQSFGRHLRTTLGLTAGEFRRELTLSAALDHYVKRLIDPYRDTLKTFEPLSTTANATQLREL